MRRVWIPLSVVVLVATVTTFGLSAEQVARDPAKAGNSTAMIRGVGPGHPWVTLHDGVELPPPSASSTETSGFHPVALAVGDVDGDGADDLVVAHAGADTGMLVLRRVSLDARRPFAPEARARMASGSFVDSAWHPGSTATPIPLAANLIDIGDLDGDGRADAVVAQHGLPALCRLSGSETGRFHDPTCVELPGGVTGLVAGSLDRRSGRDGAIVSTWNGERAELVLVRVGTAGTFETTCLATVDGAITSVALGHFDRGKSLDVAVAAGGVVTFVFGGPHGPDPATMQRATLPGMMRSLVAARLARGPHDVDAAIALMDDGGIYQIQARGLPVDSGTLISRVDQVPAGFGVLDTMIAVNSSNRPGDDLLFRGAGNTRLALRVGGLDRDSWLQLDAATSPLAMAGIGLGDDPFDDLVGILDGTPSPIVMHSTVAATHTVNSTGDGSDAILADGVCEVTPGVCTLRAAIEQANAAAGTDSIVFSIPGTGPHTIQPIAPYPAISDPVLIDATTQPGYAGTPLVEIDGSVAGNTDGFLLQAGSSTIRGLAINRFALSGIAINDANAIDNRIQANHIGTDPAGTAMRGNLGNGVFVAGDSRGTIIGADGDGVADASEGNVISNNAADGVSIGGADTSDVRVAGNHIGTVADGSAALRNGGFGVAVWDTVQGVVIGTNGDGTSDLDERNVISGNTVRGVLLTFGANGNVVAGNFIGTDSNGTVAVPNEEGGIEIANGARFNRVGTDADGVSDEAERNIISGNRAAGVVMFGVPAVEGNVIAGNFIGPDATGTVALGNEHDGISMGEAVDTRIGGPTPAERNVVAGNGGNGVSVGGLDATGTLVLGNFIGMDATGAAPLGNARDGVNLGNTAGHVVGTDGDGTDDGFEGNLISGNVSNGVTIWGPDSAGNVVAGNLIGTNYEGNAAAGNGESGVVILDLTAGNVVGTNGDGTSDVHERNVLSGNLLRGVLIAGEAENNIVAGNFIGTDIEGRAAIPNLQGGIELSNGARGNRVGTDVDGLADVEERNVISGNTTYGIALFGSPAAEDNVIAGNYIGVAADGSTALGNTTHGIQITADAHRTMIGGFGVPPRACAGPCNLIAFNGTGASRDGVRIADGIENSILGNVIHTSTGGGAIDIGPGSMTPNDPGDVDGGANNGQNFPKLTAAVTAAGTTTVEGWLDSIPSTDFHLEIYANPACDTAGAGEGEMLVASAVVTTDVGGFSVFAVPVAPEVPPGHVVTATATRLGPGGEPTDTSEFSPCIVLGAPSAAGRVPDGRWIPGNQLTLGKGSGNYLHFEWDLSCIGTDSDYALYMGTIGDFGSHTPRNCSTGGSTTLSYWIGTTNNYFLIVPHNGTREGSYGEDSAGLSRGPGPDTCFDVWNTPCP